MNIIVIKCKKKKNNDDDDETAILVKTAENAGSLANISEL
jgi:hypothetical protein